MTPTEALKLLVSTEMKPFTGMDWEAYAGCESETPMRGQNGNYDIVLDENRLLISDLSESNDLDFIYFEFELNDLN